MRALRHGVTKEQLGEEIMDKVEFLEEKVKELRSMMAATLARKQRFDYRVKARKTAERNRQRLKTYHDQKGVYHVSYTRVTESELFQGIRVS